MSSCWTILKCIIHGQVDGSLRRKLAETVFFKDVKHEKVPGLEGIRFPLRICKVKGRVLYLLPGPAHAVKNAAAQVASESKVLYFGQHMADPTGAVTNGMPIPAYGRKDAMSDRLCSLFSNPLFLLQDVTWHRMNYFRTLDNER